MPSEGKKCPECGKKMTRNMKVGDFFDGSDEWLYTCFKMHGGCGHEEKVR